MFQGYWCCAPKPDLVFWWIFFLITATQTFKRRLRQIFSFPFFSREFNLKLESQPVPWYWQLSKWQFNRDICKDAFFSFNNHDDMSLWFTFLTVAQIFAILTKPLIGQPKATNRTDVNSLFFCKICWQFRGAWIGWRRGNHAVLNWFKNAFTFAPAAPTRGHGRLGFMLRWAVTHPKATMTIVAFMLATVADRMPYYDELHDSLCRCIDDENCYFAFVFQLLKYLVLCV